MNWFFIALFGTLLWSIGNFVDKLLTDRFASKWSGTWGLVLYSSLFSLILVPIFLTLSPAKIYIDPQTAIVLVLSGVAEVTGIFLYLRALRHEDTSTVVPFFQVVPIFSFILGFTILGETLTLTQTLAGLGVIIGGILLSLDISAGQKIHFKFSLVSLLLASSFCFALFDTLFKYGALREGYWTGIVWQHIGIFLVGFTIFLFYKHARRGFLASLKESSVANIGLNVINEAFYVGGVMLFLFAIILAPVAVVATVNAFQPVFVFIFGGILTVLFPKYIKENISHRHLFHKSLSIAIIVISSVFLVS